MVASPATGAPMRFKLVPVSIIGNKKQALLDSGAIPNLMSAGLVGELRMDIKPTFKKIVLARGSSTQCAGTVAGIPVMMDEITMRMDFLVVDNPPFPII